MKQLHYRPQEALPVLRIDEPTLEMTFKVNNSPFAGREGDYVTARQIQERQIMGDFEIDGRYIYLS